MSELIAPSINLLILVGILVYYLRAPLKQFVSQRHHAIREELDQVRSLLLEATAKSEEFSSKLKAVEAETTAIRRQALEDGKAARQRILADGQRLSVNVVADSRRVAEALYSELREQLYAELSGRVLDRAEALLKDRLTGDDRARIQREFSSQVGGVQ